ncbi:response regulator [Massilia sp. TSP1-1-2]|uniref:response regulator n=1 Tax=Massilia sp. TSP1-1-2 TaxID=2804649 RepID=UPI003CEDE94C
MLKAVIVDPSALSRGLLNTVLTEGGYSVAGITHTAALGYLMVQKYRPHVFCIALEQVDDGADVVEQIRANHPKTLVFMMSGALDAPTLQKALARGVSGFIVKPFNADKVLRTIRATVIAMIKQQQSAQT